MAPTHTRIDAVVFDLLYTLVHPEPYPNGTGRLGWLAQRFDLDLDLLTARWREFEPRLEAGEAPAGADGLLPELEWLRGVAMESGNSLDSSDLARAERVWDLSHRRALHRPPASTIDALTALRADGLRLGVLSNTHALEVRAWPESAVAALVDVVGFSHIIGACKPEPDTYRWVLHRLGVPADRSVYVGDGGSGELAGARAVGFAHVVLAAQAPRRLTPDRLPELERNADTVVDSLNQIPPLIDALKS